MKRNARFSDDGTCRVSLMRMLDLSCPNRCCEGAATRAGFVMWVLNNPSTADGTSDDPTIRQLWRFTRHWGFGGMQVLNVNPFRCTDPRQQQVPPDTVLSANDQWLVSGQQRSVITVCAWGDKAIPELAKRAALLLHSVGPLYALRVTKAGNPQHPLYLSHETQLIEWKPTQWIN